MILENNLNAIFFLPILRLRFNMLFFFKLFMFCIIQHRQAINHCIVCSVGHR